MRRSDLPPAFAASLLIRSDLGALALLSTFLQTLARDRRGGTCSLGDDANGGFEPGERPLAGCKTVSLAEIDRAGRLIPKATGDRKRLLKKLLGKSQPQFVEHLTGDGPAIFEHVCRSVNDSREAFGPVMTPSCEAAHPPAVAPYHQAIPVVLNLVNPRLARWWSRHFRRLTRFDEAGRAADHHGAGYIGGAAKLGPFTLTEKANG